MKKDFYFAIILFILLIFLKFNILDEPYHWDSIDFVMGVKWTYDHNFQPPTGLESGHHPPISFFIVAFVWLIFGNSLITSHAVILFFSFISLGLVFLLTKFIYNYKSAIYATLFLFFSPLFFSQAGMVTLDIIGLALILATLFAFLNGKYGLYFLSATLLILTKEIYTVFIVSIIIYLMFKKNQLNKTRQIIKHSFPLVFLIIFLIYQKTQQGFFFFSSRVNDFVTFHFDINFFLYILKYIFVDDYRWILTIIVIITLFLKFNQLNKKGFMLLILSFLIMLLPNLFVYSLLRYTLPLLTIFYIISAISSSLLFKKNYYTIIIVGVVIILSITQYDLHRTVEPIEGAGAIFESNLEYQDVVYTHALAAEYIEQNFPKAIVLTNWPQMAELTYPYLGYVKNKIEIRSYYDKAFNSIEFDTNEIDIIYHSPQSHRYDLTLDFIENHNTTLITKFERNGKFTEIYMFNK